MAENEENHENSQSILPGIRPVFPLGLSAFLILTLEISKLATFRKMNLTDFSERWVFNRLHGVTEQDSSTCNADLYLGAARFESGES